jgi:ABC-type multidrug transport system permease subunit
MKKDRRRQALKGALVSVISSVILSVCVLSIVFFISILLDGLKGEPLWEAVLVSIFYAITTTGFLALFSAIPIGIIGALIGYFRYPT